jgi:Mpv17 / PMP22 family
VAFLLPDPDLIASFLPTLVAHAATTTTTSTNGVSAAAATAITSSGSSASSILAAATQHSIHSYVELLREYPLTTKMFTAGILSTAGDAIAQYTTFQRITNSTTSSGTSSSRKKKKSRNIIATTDDAIIMTEKEEDTAAGFAYDVKRGVVFCLFGMFYTGAFQHYWFPYLTLHIAEWGHWIHLWGTSTSVAATAANPSTALLLRYGVLYDAPPSPLALAAGKVVLNQVIMIPSLYMPIFLIVTSILGGLDVSQAIARAQSLYGPLVRRNWLFWFPTQLVQFVAVPTEWHIPFLSTAGLVWTIILSTISGTAATAETQQTVPPTANNNDDDVVQEERVLKEVTGTDTIRVIDVVQNALGRSYEQSPLLGATTTTTLTAAILMVLASGNADTALESILEESTAIVTATATTGVATSSPAETQILFIAMAGLIGWTLGPKLGATITSAEPTYRVDEEAEEEEEAVNRPNHAAATATTPSLPTATKLAQNVQVVTGEEVPPKEPIVG